MSQEQIVRVLQDVRERAGIGAVADLVRDSAPLMREDGAPEHLVQRALDLAARVEELSA
jgi:hypothetical protein